MDCGWAEPEKILKRTVEQMKGGSEIHVKQDYGYDDEGLATKLMTYAMSHGFDGCEENKCLQIFIARYKEYANGAIEKLKNTVDKYALLSVIAHSFCASALEDQARKEDVRVKTIELVRSLQDAMGLLSNLSNNPENYKPCAADLAAWTSEVDAIATKVVDNATSSINPSSWEERQAVHEHVAKDIVAKLNASTYKDGYSFKGLAYLPFTDNGQYAFLSLPVGAEDVLRDQSKQVNYVVSRYRKRAVQTLAFIRKKWGAIETKGNQILDATFSTSTSDLSNRIGEVENRFKKDMKGSFLSAGGFRALVALRCGYEFKWYELGYRYFPAGFATDGYVLMTQQSNKYKYNCGQIVFFL
ncbi:hypothetical protein AAVH_19943 [Aphelenchoides avenae]|nr:hypothetical protein AAVH_19943 [Aphelenchus avenae]